MGAGDLVGILDDPAVRDLVARSIYDANPLVGHAVDGFLAVLSWEAAGAHKQAAVIKQADAALAALQEAANNRSGHVMTA